MKNSDVKLPTFADLLRHPADFFAFGFGSGLLPVAPGTWGTLAAIPLFYLCLLTQNAYVFVGILLLGFVLGCGFCTAASRRMGVHDHGAIVWDEIIGYLVTMSPAWWQLSITGGVSTALDTVIAVVVGFASFRFFDVLKPWPISVIDRRVHGGFGIMLDDLIAGIYAAIVLYLSLRFMPPIG